MTEWISISKECPPIGTEVLVYSSKWNENKGCFYIAKRFDSKTWIINTMDENFDSSLPEWWMPLPEPPNSSECPKKLDKEPENMSVYI